MNNHQILLDRYADRKQIALLTDYGNELNEYPFRYLIARRRSRCAGNGRHFHNRRRFIRLREGISLPRLRQEWRHINDFTSTALQADMISVDFTVSHSKAATYGYENMAFGSADFQFKPLGKNADIHNELNLKFQIVNRK